MCTTENNFSVEALVAKYRNYVGENCDKSQEWDEEDGVFYMPDPNDSQSDKQIITGLYQLVAGDNTDKAVTEALSLHHNAFQKYKVGLTEDELAFLCNHFREVIAYVFMHREDWVMEDKYYPKEQVSLVDEYVKCHENNMVFIADSHFCDLAVLFKGCIVKGYTGSWYDNKEIWALGQIRMYAEGIKSEIVSGEWNEENYSYPLPEHNSIDVLIFHADLHTHFGRHGKVYSDIESLLSLLKPEGVMLYFSTIDKQEDNRVDSFRDFVVRDKAIKSMIAYESIFFHKHNEVLLLITKTPNKTVIIKDEKKSLSTAIDAQLLNSDFFWPEYYVAHRPLNGIPLSQLVSIYPLDSCEENEKVYYKDNEDNGFVVLDEYKYVPVIVPMDMGNDYQSANLLLKDLKEASNPLYSDWIPFIKPLETPCVLLYGKEGRFVAGYLTELPQTGIATLCQLLCLLPKEGVDIRYITALLFSSEVKEQLSAISDAIGISGYFSKIIDEIIVPNHTEKERLTFLSDANYEAYKSTYQQMKKAHKDYVKAIRMRKHALSQSLSSVNAMFNALNTCRTRQNGNLSDFDKISKIRQVTVRDAFDFIKTRFEEMSTTIEHIAEVEYLFGNPEKISPKEFIDEYIAKHKDSWLNFNLVYDDNNISQKCFMFPRKALEKVFDNIISNAVSHGFVDNSRKDYVIKITWHTNGFSMIIEVENNGQPIPSDRDTASLLEYGVSTALHKDGHNGIGCNEIDDIMQRYEGSVNIISLLECEFPVKYVLTFNHLDINQ